MPAQETGHPDMTIAVFLWTLRNKQTTLQIGYVPGKDKLVITNDFC